MFTVGNSRKRGAVRLSAQMILGLGYQSRWWMIVLSDMSARKRLGSPDKFKRLSE